MVRLRLGEVEVDIWVCGLSGLTAEELVDGMDDEDIRDSTGRIGRGLQLVLAERGPFDLVLLMAGTNDLPRRHADVLTLPE